MLRRTIAIGVCVALAGCTTTPTATTKGERPGFFSALLAQPDTAGRTTPVAQPATALREIKMAGGDVVVRGPDGYCVDPKTLDTNARSGFAILASCQILSNGARGTAVSPAILTVTVGPVLPVVGLPQPQALADRFDARVLKELRRDDDLIVHLSKGGDAVLANGDQKHWRGAMRLNGHLVGLALYAPKGARVAGDDGEAFVSRTIRRIRAASPEGPSPSEARAIPREDIENARDTLKRIWGRLTAR